MDVQPNSNNQPAESVDWKRLIEAVLELSPKVKDAWYQFKTGSGAKTANPGCQGRCASPAGIKKMVGLRSAPDGPKNHSLWNGCTLRCHGASMALS
jgi:hypothetical protein